MWKLTEEQAEIVENQENAKINAVAGSGKTSTLIQYAMARPRYASILYLAFNQSVKKEAERKFAKMGLSNVRIETAHSLAFSQIVRGSKFQLKKEGSYKLHEVKDILKLKRIGREANSEYILANHIQKFAHYFCNQTAQKVQEVNYLDIIEAGEARDFVEKHYEKIEMGVREWLAKMNKGEIELTHEFYLKKFQLLRPHLQYDFILFDEGQDASPVMLDVFLAQEQAKKIIVGDTHQQIYGWRHAINALEQVDFQNFNLSSSFRFNSNIALLANHYLAWKDHFGKQPSLQIKGVGNHKKIESRATLARTNLFLLKKAIDWVTKNHLESLYFEGNIHSYTYAGEGASIWDVLHLYNGKTNLVRDSLLKTMDSMEELKEYCG
ncbi:MAG: UvrD-helicase domain-containing protein, partial [Bacteroidia bacterium]